LRAACGFKRGGGLEKDAAPRADAASDHDGHRRREAERARTAYDQDGDRPRDRRADGRAAEKPDAERHEREEQDRGDEDGGDAVRKARDRRLRHGGVLHQAHNLRMGRVRNFCRIPQSARHRSPLSPPPPRFRYRRRFPRRTSRW
jgi:hypothetical protein